MIQNIFVRYFFSPMCITVPLSPHDRIYEDFCGSSRDSREMNRDWIGMGNLEEIMFFQCLSDSNSIEVRPGNACAFDFRI